MAFTKQKINGKWVVTSVGSVNGIEPDDNGNVELLPDVTSADNGKALTVQDGTWAAGSIITYKEV